MRRPIHRMERDLQRAHLDLVVIGAGPHALSLVTRLIDDDPDLLTERDRVRIAHKAGSRGRTHSAVKKHLKQRYDGASLLPSTLVIDTHGRWMAQWESDFDALDIRHTRSHADLHPCPYDFQSLRVWAEMHHRQSEFVPMDHVDRNESRAKGYGGPFTLPGTALMNDFCASLIERYGVGPLVRRGVVDDVRVVPASADGGVGVNAGVTAPCTFEVHLADGTRLTARRVVCALGPGPLFRGMRATLPWWAEDLAASLAVASEPKAAPSHLVMPIAPSERLQHSSQLTTWLRQADAHDALSCKRVLIVGGGQTAAHLALLALRRGASVRVVCRREVTIKPYDVDLEVVGDRRFEVLGNFWRMQDSERVKRIAELRGGGSMNHEAHSELMQFASRGEGAEPPPLKFMERLEVEEACWHARHAGGGGVEGDDAVSNEDGEVRVRYDDGSNDSVDLVWLATGGNLDLNLVPILASLQAQRPIRTTRGLPVLQPDLSWDAGCPLYVMGAFAQLQLGPDALNLAGARSGGVLVARALLDRDDAENNK
jgi:hypothetical protein